MREKRKFLGEKYKNISLPQRKGVLNSYNIGKSWCDHQEESWNLENCSKNASGTQIAIPEDDINYDRQECYSDYDEYTNDAANIVK